MSWEDLGIQDPNIRWNGPYQDWKSNQLGDLYEKTIDDIECYKEDIEDIAELGLYEAIINDFADWLDYIEVLAEEASQDPDFRAKLVKARSHLRSFKDQFDTFTITINWL